MEFKGKLWNLSFLGLLVHELKTGLMVIYQYEGKYSRVVILSKVSWNFPFMNLVSQGSQEDFSFI